MHVWANISNDETSFYMANILRNHVYLKFLTSIKMFSSPPMWYKDNEWS